MCQAKEPILIPKWYKIGSERAHTGVTQHSDRTVQVTPTWANLTASRWVPYMIGSHRPWDPSPLVLSVNSASPGWTGERYLVAVAPLHLARAMRVNIEGDVCKGVERGTRGSCIPPPRP